MPMNSFLREAGCEEWILHRLKRDVEEVTMRWVR